MEQRIYLLNFFNTIINSVQRPRIGRQHPDEGFMNPYLTMCINKTGAPPMARQPAHTPTENKPHLPPIAKLMKCLKNAF